METSQATGSERRPSFSERVSHLVHRVTHPQHGHHDGERATQNVQHQYGGPDNEHDLAFEAEANLAGAHAIPPFGMSHHLGWSGKKPHPDFAHDKKKPMHPAAADSSATATSTAHDVLPTAHTAAHPLDSAHQPGEDGETSEHREHDGPRHRAPPAGFTQLQA